MAERLRQDPLPPPWSYGVMRDGRIFFINEESNETTWLHPVSGKAIGSGFYDRNDLPQGWQEGVTPSGRTYYIDHLNETTTFYHPLTGKSDMDEEYPDQNETSSGAGDAKSASDPQKVARTPSFVNKKVPKTMTPLVKRNPNCKVMKEGWLQKRDSGPLGVWRKRWCVLADFCLFYYKDSTDEEHVGSIMLPSYNIGPAGPKDKGTKKFAFKCEHANMRTYYFAGSSQEDVESWMRALHAASKMQNDFNQGPSERDEEDWGAKTTLPRSISQPVNGMHDNSRPANGHPDSYGRPHSWQNGHGEYGRSPPREENRSRHRSHYEEVPRKDHPRSLQPEVYPQRQDPERDWVPARPRSVGPGDQPINRTKSLPRHAAPPSGARYTSDPYATMPRHANIQRPAVNPTYVDPREIQMRKRQQKNHLDVPEVGGSREPSVLSYPSVFGSNESDAPQRPPYPAGYEGSIDRNANYAKRPQNEVFQQKRAPTPEQRSVLQSPMQQSPPSMEPEQRNTLNSPMSYERPPSVDSRSQSIDRRSPSVQRSRSMQAERVPPPQVQVEVQMTRSAAPELRSSPSQRSQRSFNSYNGPSPQSRGGRDSADVAPTRERIQVERSGTLREERGGDQLAPLPSHGNRMNIRQQNNPNRRQVQPGQPTSRFRMWQQKTQPYIMLSTGIRIRLSIAANDLLGKSHEELVLFLIQLRRDKANMEEWLRMIDSELDLLQKNPSSGNQQKLKPRQSDSLRRSHSNLNEDEVYEAELKREKDEVSRELEVSLPLINLVDNLVRMGSLYGGKNELIAHEFYRNQVQNRLPPMESKMMVEYSRQQEEDKLMNEIEEDYRKMQTAEDRELDEKLRRLRELDQKLQEISSRVYVLKEEKDEIEVSMERLRQEYDREWENKEAQLDIEEQQVKLDRQLIRVRSHLAQGTKDLEDITAENAKLEHEISLLRMKQEKGEPTQNGYYPGGRELMEIRDEVSDVQTKMTTLDRKRAELMAQMAGLRKGPSNGTSGPETPPQQPSQQTFNFQSTDLDTEETWDASVSSDQFSVPPSYGSDVGASSRLGRPQDLPVQPHRYSLPPQRTSSPQVSSRPQRPHSQGEPMVSRSQQGDQFAAPRQHHSLPPGAGRSPGQYSTQDRRQQEGHRGTPTDPRRMPEQRRSADNFVGSPDQYGRSPSQGSRSNQYDRHQPPTHHGRSPGQEQLIQPQQSMPSYSQPQGDLRSPQGGRRSSSGSYKVTDLDTRQTWDITQVDIRSPVDDRPMLSPGEVLPRRDPSLHYQRGPPSLSETPSDSEVAELTRRAETLPRMGPSQQPPPPKRRSDSYQRVKQHGTEDLNPPFKSSLNDHVSTNQQPNIDRSTHDIPEPSITSTHDALQHAPPSSMSAFTPIVQIKENLVVPQQATAVNSAPTRLSPPPVITQEPPKAATEIIPNQPASLQTTPSSVDDKSKQKIENKSRSKEPPSYNQHVIGFKPSSSQPRSRDSDTESTSSSIRNSSVYGPTPYRRSVESSIRRISSVQGIEKKRKAPQYNRAVPYKPPGSGKGEPMVDREVVSDTEAMPPPPSKPSTQGLKPVETSPAPRKHRSAAERLIRSIRSKTLPGGFAVRPPSPPSPRESTDGEDRKRFSLDAGVDMLKNLGKQMMSGDLEIGALEKALKTVDDDPTPAPSTNGDVVKSTLKNVEVDESTGGGLMSSHSLPLSYLRAKRRVVKFSFFATVHPYPSSRKLGMPGKIIIPERYNPAEDEDIEDKSKLSPEELAAREEKAENIAKMLSEHSLQSWHPSELNPNWLKEEQADLHSKMEEEKMNRQETLAKTRALAEEVKQHSLRRGRSLDPKHANNISVEYSYQWSSEEER